MNQPMMNIFLHAKGTWRADKNGFHVGGMAVPPSQWKAVLRTELQSWARTENGNATISDPGILKLAGQIRQALGLPSLQDQLQSVGAGVMTGHAALRQIQSEWDSPRFQRQLIVAQVGDSLAPAEIKSLIEEEYDHIQHVGLPGGMAALPIHITENSPVARKAVQHLAQLGYPDLLAPGDPGRMASNAIMTSEVIVRLMRQAVAGAGHLQQQARDLALDYITGLASLGKHADVIIEQLNHAPPDQAQAPPGRKPSQPSTV
jgi:hypothetical protein